MKLLALDTSSKVGAIAALEWDHQAKNSKPRLVSEWLLNVDATHSDKLLWGIHRVLEAAQWKLDDVGLVAAGVGPGSFTGLRIGLTTARTLAHTLNIPLIGVSSLAALARPAASWLSLRKERVVVIAATDACKGELFALYGSAKSVADCVVLSDGDSSGLWKRGVEEVVETPDVLVKNIKKKLMEGAKEPAHWLVIGEAKERYADVWKGLPKSKELHLAVAFSEQVQGRCVGYMAWEAYQAGLSRKALDVHPRYLRAADAEIKLKAGLLPPGPTRGGGSRHGQ